MSHGIGRWIMNLGFSDEHWFCGQPSLPYFRGQESEHQEFQVPGCFKIRLSTLSSSVAVREMNLVHKKES